MLKQSSNPYTICIQCDRFKFAVASMRLRSVKNLDLTERILIIGWLLDCLAVSVFFSLFSLQASVTVKNRGGAISNDRMVAPSHFGCKQRLLKLNHIRIP